MIVPDVLICSLSNRTSTCQSKHWNNGGVAHSSYPQIHHSTNAKDQTSALQEVLSKLRSETHLVNLGPEGGIISITPNAQ